MLALYFSGTVAILIHFLRSHDRRLLLLDLIFALRTVSLFRGEGDVWSSIADAIGLVVGLVLAYILAPRSPIPPPRAT